MEISRKDCVKIRDGLLKLGKITPPLTRYKIKNINRFVENYKTLNKQEEKVVKARFGLVGTPKTNAQIAKDWGVTREWIRQLLERAVKKT
jgi:DNA-directed RNA polymerase sigma subunit (sigma70/sigma32)